MTTMTAAAGSLDFTEVDPLPLLDAADDGALDRLPFGVIRMDRDGIVQAYNAWESRMAGLRRQTVLSRHFFTEVAPCTNNRLVAGRFQAEPALDASIDYVFCLRMHPTAVRLRLLQRRDGRFAYLLVERGERGRDVHDSGSGDRSAVG